MIKNILWDFDGVILDSMKVRDWGFREIFKSFGSNEVNSLLEYHNLNGGLSRYVKIRYFFDNILLKPISEEEIFKYANRFSDLMKKELIKGKYLINDSLSFIKENYTEYNFHIVSGSDQNELRFLCKELKIDKYFVSVYGSPTPKKKLVKNLINSLNYNLNETCLIGDSINDREAADHNYIEFYGYNNEKLLLNITRKDGYINSFESTKIFL